MRSNLDIVWIASHSPDRLLEGNKTVRASIEQDRFPGGKPGPPLSRMSCGLMGPGFRRDSGSKEFIQAELAAGRWQTRNDGLTLKPGVSR
jgi:hypothetical protein